MKVLIAIDATPSCQGVVQAAAARPWPAGSSFLLATAIDPFFFARAPALLDQAKNCARQHLEHTAECSSTRGMERNHRSDFRKSPAGDQPHSLAIGVRMW